MTTTCRGKHYFSHTGSVSLQQHTSLRRYRKDNISESTSLSAGHSSAPAPPVPNQNHWSHISTGHQPSLPSSLSCSFSLLHTEPCSFIYLFSTPLTRLGCLACLLCFMFTFQSAAHFNSPPECAVPSLASDSALTPTHIPVEDGDS